MYIVALNVLDVADNVTDVLSDFDVIPNRCLAHCMWIELLGCVVNGFMGG